MDVVNRDNVALSFYLTLCGTMLFQLNYSGGRVPDKTRTRTTKLNRENRQFMLEMVRPGARHALTSTPRFALLIRLKWKADAKITTIVAISGTTIVARTGHGAGFWSRGCRGRRE